jgi:hypothetical protein
MPGAKIMTTTEAITPITPGETPVGGGPAAGPARRPVRREEYLHRVGSHATLLVVEWSPAADGSLRKTMRFIAWPGL